MGQFDMRGKLFFFVLILHLRVLPGFGVAMAQESHANGAAECSIFESMYLNAVGITAGDVVVEVTTNFDTVKPAKDGSGPEGIFQSTTLRYRCVFDFEKSRFCMIKQQGPDTRVDMADLSGKPPETSPDYTGWSIDFRKKELLALGQEGPLPWQIAGDGAVPVTLERFRFYDPRSISFVTIAGLVEQEFGLIRKICSGKTFWSRAQLAEDVLKITLFSGEYDDGSEMAIWEFDLKNSLPLKFSELVWHAGNKVFYPGREGNMEWTVVDGYDVISSKTWKDYSQLRSVNGKSYFGSLTTTTRFHWFSVNQEVDGRFFDGSVLSSPAELRKCLQMPEKK